MQHGGMFGCRGVVLGTVPAGRCSTQRVLPLLIRTLTRPCTGVTRTRLHGRGRPTQSGWKCPRQCVGRRAVRVSGVLHTRDHGCAWPARHRQPHGSSRRTNDGNLWKLNAGGGGQRRNTPSAHTTQVAVPSHARCWRRQLPATGCGTRPNPAQTLAARRHGRPCAPAAGPTALFCRCTSDGNPVFPAASKL